MTAQTDASRTTSRDLARRRWASMVGSGCRGKFRRFRSALLRFGSDSPRGSRPWWSSRLRSVRRLRTPRPVGCRGRRRGAPALRRRTSSDHERRSRFPLRPVEPVVPTPLLVLTASWPSRWFGRIRPELIRDGVRGWPRRAGLTGRGRWLLPPPARAGRSHVRVVLVSSRSRWPWCCLPSRQLTASGVSTVLAVTRSGAANASFFDVLSAWTKPATESRANSAATM